MKKIGILGGGVWGSALAKVLSSSKVCIFARNKKIVDSINDYKINPNLKFSTFNKNVSSSSNIKDLEDSDFLFIALPAQNIRDVIVNYKIKNKDQQIIIASKGIEMETNLFLSDVIKKILKTDKVSIISGPSFSDEVAQNLPTAVTLACSTKEIFDKINLLFVSKNFRLYFSDDIMGCQLGGAIKNIYAIASGISIGLNLGENARSSLITRSFVEISRIGKFFNINQKTLFGLSCLGDLILTCGSIKSRNTKFGNLIASQQNISIKDHLESLSTTEGYYSVKAFKFIATKKKIDMPIMDAVYNILHKKSSIPNEIKNLLERPSGDEIF